MTPPPTLRSRAQEKRAWLLIVGATAVAILFYAALNYQRLGAHSPGERVSPPGVRAGVYSLAVVCIGISWTFARRSTDASLPSSVFRQRSVVATVLAESCGLFGLLLSFLTGGWTDFLILAGAAEATILFVVLPAGLSYWRQRESAGFRESSRSRRPERSDGSEIHGWPAAVQHRRPDRSAANVPDAASDLLDG